MALLTPTIQRQLYDETDARFWSQTGYNPGKKLVAADLYDQAMMPVWQAIYKKVYAEWASGRLVLTKDHPAVQQAIVTAATHTADAIEHTPNAAADVMPEHKAEHAAKAQTSQAQAKIAAQQAAALQPPSVPPAIVVDAAKKIYDLVAGSPTVSPPQAVAAQQAAAAPAVAEAAQQTGTPAPDKKSTGKTLAVIGGCFAAIALAGFLNSRDDARGGRYR